MPMARTRKRGRSRIALSFGAVALILAACSPAGANPPRGAAVDVRIRDFAIDAPATSVRQGTVTFHVSNRGPTTHEFVVVRTDDPQDALPLAPDGMSVDEDAVAPVGEIEEVADGSTADLTLGLAPGRYVFFCNLEGHYLAGMHAAFEVADA
jgi:uncharacterized cupredoxin-like copper-binding protein